MIDIILSRSALVLIYFLDLLFFQAPQAQGSLRPKRGKEVRAGSWTKEVQGFQGVSGHGYRIAPMFVRQTFSVDVFMSLLPIIDVMTAYCLCLPAQGTQVEPRGCFCSCDDDLTSSHADRTQRGSPA